MNYPLASSTWGEEELKAIQRVVSSNRFTMGDEVLAFEKEFAMYSGSKFAVMFNSGSSANLALITAARYRKSCLIKPGDEVLVPAVSWSTTFYPIHQIGAILKFVDIDQDTLNIDTDKLEEAISPKTKAIFGVNLLGNPADWKKISELAENYRLTLFEDNCESLGASLGGRKTGTFGIGGTHSFFFSHHMSTMEGGVVITDDEMLDHAMRSIRAHGWTRDLPKENYVYSKSGNNWDDLYRFVLPGYNLRPLEIEAAVGRIQLEKLDTYVEVRRKNAEKFMLGASEFPEIRIQKENGKSSWFGFSIVLKDRLRDRRSELIRFLDIHGIESRPIVAGNFARNPVIEHLSHVRAEVLEVADEIHDHGLFIGNHHFDLSKEIDKFFEVLQDFRSKF